MSTNLTPFQLEKRIAELVELITPLQAELDTHRKALRELQSEFKRGDIIQWKNRTGRVVDILEDSGFLTWLVENIRKDGSVGGRVKVRSYLGPTLKP